jgi:hypothetical protein
MRRASRREADRAVEVIGFPDAVSPPVARRLADVVLDDPLHGIVVRKVPVLESVTVLDHQRANSGGIINRDSTQDHAWD